MAGPAPPAPASWAPLGRRLAGLVAVCCGRLGCGWRRLAGTVVGQLAPATPGCAGRFGSDPFTRAWRAPARGTAPALLALDVLQVLGRQTGPGPLIGRQRPAHLARDVEV